MILLEEVGLAWPLEIAPSSLDGMTALKIINGTNWDDVLIGTNKADDIYGYDGDDTLSGLKGNDTLDGGAGNDILDGGAGNDDLYANGGNDTAYGGGGDDTLYWNANGNFTFYGGAGKDVVVVASDFDVTIYIASDVEFVSSGGGDDTICVVDAKSKKAEFFYGADGNDWLVGGRGADILEGGAGSDTLIGGSGADQLYGGDGADHFVITDITRPASKAPLIADLSSDDIIDLSQIDANSKEAGDQAFTVVNHFTHHPGQMTITYDAKERETIVHMDINGDALTDTYLLLSGDHRDFTHFVL